MALKGPGLWWPLSEGVAGDCAGRKREGQGTALGSQKDWILNEIQKRCQKSIVQLSLFTEHKKQCGRERRDYRVVERQVGYRTSWHAQEQDRELGGLAAGDRTGEHALAETL